MTEKDIVPSHPTSSVNTATPNSTSTNIASVLVWSKVFEKQIQETKFDLLNFAKKLTGNPEDTNDLYQETLLRARSGYERYNQWTNFKARIMTIMKNIFINIYRKKRNHQTYSQDPARMPFSQTITNDALSQLSYDDIMRIVHALDSTYSEPFLLFYEWYKYEEIAEIMNLPMGTIKSRIFFARKQLRDALEADPAYTDRVAAKKK